MRLDDDVIDGAAEEGARVLALALLADAEDAAARFGAAADEEALHDFRVGLRRVRSTLRAFRPWLSGSVKVRVERRLRKQARSTNAARDAEVQVAWLESKREALPSARYEAGLDLLVQRLEDRRRAPDSGRLVARFTRTAARLHRKLQTYERRVDAGGAGSRTTFGGVLATLVGDHLEVLREGLGSIRGATDQAAVHEARIAGKRLRYLLEPLRGNRHADASDAVKQLKRLQDLLGDLHDSHVLAAENGDALVEATAERTRRVFAAVAEDGATGPALREELRDSPREGLLALVRLVRERREALFADVEREWRAGAFEALAAEVQVLAQALESRSGGKLERDRRYVLAGLPPRAAGVAPIEIGLAWLPGARLRERIRHVRGPEGDRYWRGLKQGVGRLRVESEEETTREVFEALWPLTQGRRVSKRRRTIEEGKLAWDVDEFPDRGLVLARVRFPAGAGELALPDWIRPLVLREVTDDPAFLDEQLAQTTAPEATAPEAIAEVAALEVTGETAAPEVTGETVAPDGLAEQAPEVSAEAAPAEPAQANAGDPTTAEAIAPSESAQPPAW